MRERKEERRKRQEGRKEDRRKRDEGKKGGEAEKG